jgi:hypothetical protein
MSSRSQPAARPLYHAGQELYMQRDVKLLPRGAKVKVRRWMLSGRELRYEVEYELVRHWCYEYDMAKQFVA